MVSTVTDRRHGLNGNLAFKAPVDLATTANITLYGEQAIDGTVTNASRVLVKNQTAAVENGLYDTASSAWTRSVDADGVYDLVKGTMVKVNGGATNSGRIYEISSPSPTIGTDDIEFSQSLTSSLSTLDFTQAGTGAVSRSAQDKMRERISVLDFGATAGGLVSASAAFQAAHDYADSLIGTAAYNDLWVQIDVPPGVYLFTSTVTVTSPRVSFVGPGTIVGTGSFFDIGDRTNTTRIRENALVNLTMYNTSTTNTAVAVTLYRTIGSKIIGCNINNFYVGIDTYRASTDRVEGGRLDNSARTVAALAGMRRQGTDETLTTGETYTPGGGTHVTDWEISGSSSTVDTTSGILLMACDGFYMENTHIVGCERDFVAEPAATAENHIIVSTKLVNCYLDQPSIFAAVPYCFVLGGTVKKTITMADGSTQQSIYRDIRVANSQIRPSNYGRHAVFISVTEGDNWATTASQRLEDLSFIGNSIRQATSQAFQCNGAALGSYVEPRGLNIEGNHFDGNNSAGATGAASDINIQAESATVQGNIIGDAGASGADYTISAIVSDGGATDNTNPSVIIALNDLTKAVTAPLVKPINITPSETGANTLETGNLLAGTGKRIDQVYKTTLTSTTATELWSYTIPQGAAGYVSIELTASSTDGARALAYTWSNGIRRNGGATSMNTTSTGMTAGLAWNPDTLVAPTAELVTNTLTLTGRSSTTGALAISSHIRMTLSR